MSQSPETEPDALSITAEEPYLQALVKINGMIHAGASLSGHERNCCFLNTGDTRFANVSAISGIDFPDDGRAVASVDWDHDGDLDLWVTNRTGPRIRYLDNGNTPENSFVTIKLTGRDCNRNAIGSRVELVLSGGETLVRTVRAGEGFLSQSSKRLHFGLAGESSIDQVVVHWPSGDAQTVFGLLPNKHYQLTQGDPPVEWAPPNVALTRSRERQAEHMTTTATANKPASIRVVLPAPIAIPSMPYTVDGKTMELTGSREAPLLVNLWASWCQPCIRELSDWSDGANRFERAGLDVLLLNVDGLDESQSTTEDASIKIAKMALPFNNGHATAELVEKLQIVHNELVRHGAMPVPVSFLLDQQGRLRAIYKGAADLDQVIADVEVLKRRQPELLEASLPFKGTWHGKHPPFRYANLVRKVLDAGFTEDAKQYLVTMPSVLKSDPDISTLLVRIGNEYFKKREFRDAELLYKEAVQIQPRLAIAWFDLGLACEIQGRHQEAIAHYRKAIELDPSRSEALLNLGVLLARGSQLQESLDFLNQSIRARPDFAIAFYHRGRVFEKQKRRSEALQSYRKAHELDRTHAPTTLALARCVERDGDANQARELYEQLVAAHPANAEARVHLGVALEAVNLSAAIEQYRHALTIEPANLSAQNNLAWLLATVADESLRDATEAIVLAEAAAKATKSQQPAILDTLAAAYANSGQFEKAAATASRAIQLAARRDLNELRAQIESRLRLYRKREPYRLPTNSSHD